MINRRFFLEGLECICRIGIYDHERAAPQRVLIDAELLMSPVSEPMSDNIENSLNYDLIRDTIVEIVGSRHFDLQETLARELFDVLRTLDGVIGLRVRTAKPDAYPDCEQIAYQLSDL
tara:strand:- start:2283 stop:2636 length:354 start_codon:yes stop_codon:yes gene_type:complete